MFEQYSIFIFFIVVFFAIMLMTVVENKFFYNESLFNSVKKINKLKARISPEMAFANFVLLTVSLFLFESASKIILFYILLMFFLVEQALTTERCTAKSFNLVLFLVLGSFALSKSVNTEKLNYILDYTILFFCLLFWINLNGIKASIRRRNERIIYVDRVVLISGLFFFSTLFTTTVVDKTIVTQAWPQFLLSYTIGLLAIILYYKKRELFSFAKKISPFTTWAFVALLLIKGISSYE